MAVPGRYTFTGFGAAMMMACVLAGLSTPAKAGEVVHRSWHGAVPVAPKPIVVQKPRAPVLIQPYSPVARTRSPAHGTVPAPIGQKPPPPPPLIVTPTPQRPALVSPVVAQPAHSAPPPSPPIILAQPRPPGTFAPPVIATPVHVGPPPTLPPIVLPPVGPPKAPQPVIVPPPLSAPDITFPTVTVATPVIAIPNGFTFVGGAATFSGGIAGGGEVVFANVITGGETEGVEPGLIENLSLGETITEDVEVKDFVTRDAMVPERTAIRAICLDDRGRPNPASQVSGARGIPAGFEGEVYRCVSGSALQATLAPVVNGAPDWAAAETLTCARNEALVVRGGKPGCAPQIPARECNERSLLRKYGPGEKVATLQRNRKVQEMVTRLEKRTRELARPIGNLSLDGGVGQGIN